MPTSNFKRITWPFWSFLWFSSILPYIHKARTVPYIKPQLHSIFITLQSLKIIRSLIQCHWTRYKYRHTISRSPHAYARTTTFRQTMIISLQIPIMMILPHSMPYNLCHENKYKKITVSPLQYQFCVSTFPQHEKDLFQTADACCTIHGIPNASKFFNSEELSCYEIAQWRRTQVQGLSLAVSRLTVSWLKKYKLHATKKKKSMGPKCSLWLEMCLYRV